MKKPMKRSYQLEITRRIKELRIELYPLRIRPANKSQVEISDF